MKMPMSSRHRKDKAPSLHKQPHDKQQRRFESDGVRMYHEQHESDHHDVCLEETFPASGSGSPYIPAKGFD